MDLPHTSGSARGRWKTPEESRRRGLPAPAAELPQDDEDRFRSLEGIRRTREPPRGHASNLGSLRRREDLPPAPGSCPVSETSTLQVQGSSPLRRGAFRG